MQQEHRRQAVQQTALADIINSCRLLAQIAWPEFFESISWAESELAADPAGVYSRLDFATADRCRSAVEEIARWSKRSEQEIIEQALALAKTAEDEVGRHVGYYLIDAAGRRLSGQWVPGFPSRNGHGAGFAHTRRARISGVFLCSRSRWWRLLCFSLLS